MIPLICGVLFFQGDKKDKTVLETGTEKNKIAFDGGVERRAENTCLGVFMVMGTGRREEWGERTHDLSCY